MATLTFGESVFVSAPLRFVLKTRETLDFIENLLLSMFMLWMTVSPYDAFSAPLAHRHENT